MILNNGTSPHDLKTKPTKCSDQILVFQKLVNCLKSGNYHPDFKWLTIQNMTHQNVPFTKGQIMPPTVKKRNEHTGWPESRSA